MEKAPTEPLAEVLTPQQQMWQARAEWQEAMTDLAQAVSLGDKAKIADAKNRASQATSAEFSAQAEFLNP